MTVIETIKDPQAQTLQIVAEFEAAPERVWKLWEDPRKLELWWGPPGYPATFTRHEFVEGGQSRYFMSNEADDRHYGWWQTTRIDPLRRIDFDNGLAGDDGEPEPGMPPMPSEVTFQAAGTGTRMTVTTRFLDAEQMESMIERGMAEGMSQAIGQCAALLSLASAPR